MTTSWTPVTHPSTVWVEALFSTVEYLFTTDEEPFLMTDEEYILTTKSIPNSPTIWV